MLSCKVLLWQKNKNRFHVTKVFNKIKERTIGWIKDISSEKVVVFNMKPYYIGTIYIFNVMNKSHPDIS